MNKVFVDDNLRLKLGDFTQPVQLCDEKGHIVASVFPTGYFHKASVSEEELDRRAHSSEKRYSTSEVLKHLESL
jgi:hypothetical protein